MQAALRHLQDLGLSRLEAEVYTFLLSNRPTTAYGIGKRLGRPTANVYKAVDALAHRGAVLIEEGDHRVCRAVPAGEFLDHTNRAFHSKTIEAAKLLASLEQQTDDERVYRLESPAQLFERCRQMLEERCEQIAVIDAFPAALAAILPSIELAVSRGMDIFVEAYEPIRIDGAHVVVAGRIGEQVLEQWKSQQLNVVVDGRECLAALLNTELTEVYQGLWTNSVYLSCIMHSGRLAEHTLVQLRNALAADPSGASLPPLLANHPFLLHSQIPGYRDMLSRYAATSR